MKNFALTSVLALQLLTVVSFGQETIVVKEENAKSIVASLSEMGAFTRTYDGMDFQSVKNLHCTFSPHAFIWATCTMQDAEAARETSGYNADANQFLGTLMNLGLKYTSTSAIENTEMTVQSIHCMSQKNLQGQIESTCTIVQ